MLLVVVLVVVSGAVVVGVPLCAMVTSSSSAVVVTSSTAKVGTDLGGYSVVKRVCHDSDVELSTGNVQGDPSL